MQLGLEGLSMAVNQSAQVSCALTLLCGCIFAQTTSATLQGTVVDPGDAAVPGVSIELKNTSTGAVRSTTSTADGIFRFNSLEPAVYSLRSEERRVGKECRSR